MDETDVTIRLPRRLLEAAEAVARRRDETLGRVIREALTDQIARMSKTPKRLNRADEQLLGPLRALLASDFGCAKCWQELQGRLMVKGYALREAGGGLALHAHPSGERLCKASELGHSYGDLMRRFGRPFPGHAHRWLADRLLGMAAGDAMSGVQDADAAPEGFEVIERNPPRVARQVN